MTGNDLYILPSPVNRAPIRVTSSGNASLFHGVPDWVYEEEVFSADFALWWSPSSAKVAYLKFDETDVDEFTFPVYNPTENSYEVVPYPGSVTMKYPKPGYSNPLVSVHVFELDRYYEAVDAGDPESAALDHASLELTWEGRLSLNNSIIAEIAWVANSTVLLKEVNRAGNNGSIVLFDLDQGVVNIGETTRKLGKDGEQGDDGWIDSVCFSYFDGLVFTLTSLVAVTKHNSLAVDLDTRWPPRIPRHCSQRRWIQPYSIVQSCFFRHPKVLDQWKLGSNRRYVIS